MCKEWSDERRDKFVKHKQSLAKKRDYKKRMKSRSDPLLSACTGRGNLDPVSEGMDTSGGIIESDSSVAGSAASAHINQLVDSRFEEVKASLDSRLDAFSNKIDERFVFIVESLATIRQNNPSLSESPVVPVQSASEQGNSDPSPLHPHNAAAQREGNRVEPVQDGSSKSPGHHGLMNEVDDLFCRLREIGVEIPLEVAVSVFDSLQGKDPKDPGDKSLGSSQGKSVSFDDQGSGKGFGISDKDRLDAGPSGVTAGSRGSSQLVDPMDHVDKVRGDSDEDSIDPSKDKDNVDFRGLFDLVIDTFTQAKPLESKPPPARCLHESVFGEVPSGNPENLRFRLYDRLVRVREDVQDSYAKAVRGGKRISGTLPHKRGVYKVADDPYLASPSTINPEFLRFAGKKLSDKSSIYFMISEILKVEDSVKYLQSSQSFLLWLVSTLFMYLKDSDFSPRDPALFNKLSSSMSLALVNQAEASQFLSAFLTNA